MPGMAQRPTAEPLRPAVTFWPLDAGTGNVVFNGQSHHSSETPTQAALRLRWWLMTCFANWRESSNSSQDKPGFWVELDGEHSHVVLRCWFAVELEHDGFRYSLSRFQVGAPTGAGLMQWHELHRLLNDPDFRPDIAEFKVQLQQALAQL